METLRIRYIIIKLAHERSSVCPIWLTFLTMKTPTPPAVHSHHEGRCLDLSICNQYGNEVGREHGRGLRAVRDLASVYSLHPLLVEKYNIMLHYNVSGNFPRPSTHRCFWKIPKYKMQLED